MLALDETVLSKIVNGFREPAPDLQDRIAKMLECDSAWLFERTEKRSASASAPGGLDS